MTIDVILLQDKTVSAVIEIARQRKYTKLNGSQKKLGAFSRPRKETEPQVEESAPIVPTEKVETRVKLLLDCEVSNDFNFIGHTY